MHTQLYQKIIHVQTRGRKIINLSDEISRFIDENRVSMGLCNVFLAHTSASLIFCENADPDVCRDLEAFMQRLVPDNDPLYLHNAEGPDDMPAHVRSVLTQNSLNIPIVNGKLALGTWQGVFLWEHRLSPHNRQITMTTIGQSETNRI